jgi:hypothetical protein
VTALPMGCQQCGLIRADHYGTHRWQPPPMQLVLDRAAAIKQKRTP